VPSEHKNSNWSRWIWIVYCMVLISSLVMFNIDNWNICRYWLTLVFDILFYAFSSITLETGRYHENIDALIHTYFHFSLNKVNHQITWRSRCKRKAARPIRNGQWVYNWPSCRVREANNSLQCSGLSTISGYTLPHDLWVTLTAAAVCTLIQVLQVWWYCELIENCTLYCVLPNYSQKRLCTVNLIDFMN
jgi:hypothetical protein